MDIRPLSEHDHEEILRIDEALKKASDPPTPRTLAVRQDQDDWEARITYAIRRDSEGSWVALEDGQVIGFLIADVRGHEFGFSQPTGWLEVLAVHPAHQRKDVASKLLERVMERFRAKGVEDIRTLVGGKHPELKSFFQRAGFEPEPVVVYHKKVPVR